MQMQRKAEWSNYQIRALFDNLTTLPFSKILQQELIIH